MLLRGDNRNLDLIEWGLGLDVSVSFFPTQALISVTFDLIGVTCFVGSGSEIPMDAIAMRCLLVLVLPARHM